MKVKIGIIPALTKEGKLEIDNNYLQYIEKIKDETPNELIQSNVIGTIIHATFENLYKHFGDKEITLETYQDIYDKYFEQSHKEALIASNFPNGLPDSGFNYLSSKIMDKMINNFINYELKFLKTNNKMKIIGLEQELCCSFDIPKKNIKVNLLVIK